MKPHVRSVAQRLFSQIQAGGAVAVETDILQSADALLDLYGEDIRARAYVTQDPGRGEMMLRPDFTVPIAQKHMETGSVPARYTYMGEVFRKQNPGSGRANEYLQVGYERFGDDDPAQADADVFACFRDLLGSHGLTAKTGDNGILTAAVKGLNTSEHRRRALMRHIWRPQRFRGLLDRFGGRGATIKGRDALLRELTQKGAAATLAAAGPQIGLRSAQDIHARLDVLRTDAAEPPLSGTEIDALNTILTLEGPAPEALVTLRDIAADLPAISPALDAVDARLAALTDRGIDVGALRFEGSYGRLSLEYYDGFVFGLYAPDKPDLPPVATGGRYDALTHVLGRGRGVPAVGGVVRPEIVAQLGDTR